MSAKVIKRSIILMVTILLLNLPTTIFAGSTGIDYDYIDHIINIIDNFYIEEVSAQTHQTNIIKGLLNNLDRHTTYYNKDEFSRFIESLSGSFVGIGAYIKEENGEIVIVSTIAGSNAEKAGLKSGDVILKVDFKDVKGMDADNVSSLIRGVEGTFTRIVVRREGRLRGFLIKRAMIIINPVSYEIMNNDIGYIALDDFTSDATYEVRRALNHMDEKRITKLILDLRNNPGGYLDQAVNISRLFVPKGPIVNIKDNTGVITTYSSYLDKNKYNLVVLVNENSASASEIVAAAIKDSGAGYIVGTKTYGKGSVQSLLQLPKGDGLKITIAEYYSPNMNKINGIGVTPDLVIRNDVYDMQLEKAIEYFK